MEPCDEEADPELAGHARVTPVTPIAHEIIEAQFGPGLEDLLTSTTKSILINFSFTNPAKRNALEVFLIRNFAARQSACISFSGRFAGSLQLRDLLTVEFLGQGVPDRRVLQRLRFDRSRPMMLVPKSETYPHVDFFLWDPVEAGGVLYALQVTLDKPVKHHFGSQTEFFARHAKQWAQVFDVGDTDRRIRFVFIADNRDGQEIDKHTIAVFNDRDNELCKGELADVLLHYQRKA
jgi:hypothetical protein